MDELHDIKEELKKILKRLEKALGVGGDGGVAQPNDGGTGQPGNPHQ